MVICRLVADYCATVCPVIGKTKYSPGGKVSHRLSHNIPINPYTLGYLSELYSELWQKTRRSEERLVFRISFISWRVFLSAYAESEAGSQHSFEKNQSASYQGQYGHKTQHNYAFLPFCVHGQTFHLMLLSA